MTKRLEDRMYVAMNKWLSRNGNEMNELDFQAGFKAAIADVEYKDKIIQRLKEGLAEVINTKSMNEESNYLAQHFKVVAEQTLKEVAEMEG